MTEMLAAQDTGIYRSDSAAANPTRSNFRSWCGEVLSQQQTPEKSYPDLSPQPRSVADRRCSMHCVVAPPVSDSRLAYCVAAGGIRTDLAGPSGRRTVRARPG